MIDRFSHKVKHWITFNEQNIFFFGSDAAFRIASYLKGDKTTVEQLQIQHNTSYAHAAIANYIHDTTDAKISGMVSYSEVYPANSHPESVRMAREHDEIMNMAYLEVAVTGKYPSKYLQFKSKYVDQLDILDHEEKEISLCRSDYLSFAYYFSTAIDHSRVPFNYYNDPTKYFEYGGVSNPHVRTTEWDWQIDPTGFRNVLNKIHSRFNLPVFPIENGIGVHETWDGVNPVDDQYRIDYMQEHINAMLDAIHLDGVPVLGYLGWGLIDLLSSKGDMRKRYGLVYVNRENLDIKDMKSSPKRSYYWFKDLIEKLGYEVK